MQPTYTYILSLCTYNILKLRAIKRERKWQIILAATKKRNTFLKNWMVI